MTTMQTGFGEFPVVETWRKYPIFPSVRIDRCHLVHS